MVGVRLLLGAVLLASLAEAAGIQRAAVDVTARRGALNDAIEALAQNNGSGSGAVLLRLAPGRHELRGPLVLEAPHHNGLRIEGAADGSSVISGGKSISPSAWSVHAPAGCQGCCSIMRAELPAGTKYSRHLFVGGRRANWTRTLFRGGHSTSTGYMLKADALGINLTHNGGARVEMVYRGRGSAGVQWAESRIPVTSIDPANGNITMAVLGFAAGRAKKFGLPQFMENAFELLGHPQYGRAGDWYLDHDAGYVYYVTGATPPTKCPRGPAGVPPAVLAQEEVLVDARPGVSKLEWAGVTFSEATWLAPSSSSGFVEVQAGATLRGPTPPPGHADWKDSSTWTPTEGNLRFTGVKGASLEGCTFTHLGACGVALVGGTQNVTISKCNFSDISGSAVTIGGVDTYNITDPSKQEAYNAILDSRISSVAVEFHGAPGIIVFYARDTSIVHNEISDLPYSGVSFGWGWGHTMEITWPRMPWDARNEISSNNIHDIMQLLGDGGGIYTLGPQGNRPYIRGPSGTEYPDTPVAPLTLLPPSIIKNNYIHDTGPVDGAPQEPGYGSHAPGGVYNDQGSTNWDVVDNVVVDTPLWLQGCRRGVLSIAHMNYSHNRIACDRKAPHAGALCKRANEFGVCPLIDDKVYGAREQIPAAYQAIMAAAGPRE